jgi:fatty-acyl-CoA synthase
MLNLLTHGGCSVLQEAFEPGEALRLIEEERCTIYYGTPNMAYAMLQHPDFARRDVSSLRTGSAGGSPDQMRWVMKLGAEKICSIYGLTELYATTHITDAEDDLELRLHSVGKPLPGIQTKIVSPDGALLPVGAIGELLIKDRFEGYYKDDDLTARSLDAEGYFKTGDLVCADEAGNIYFRGRLKEMIKSGGINVSPAETELVLMSHPGIEFAQVVGVPDTVHDEIVAAVIVLKANAVLSVEETLNWCRSQLAGYKVPRLVRFVTERELPLTSTGKIQKNQIAAKFFPSGSVS